MEINEMVADPYIISDGYKSPITITENFINSIIQERDNQIMSQIKMVVDVDKQELIKALNYDRNQYEEGYKAGFLANFNHGHWIKTDFGDYKCSVCGHHEEMTYTDFSDFQCHNNFCRGCGAIMDESEVDNEV